MSLRRSLGSALSSARLWKLLGLAGVAGVAATGVIIARDQRRRSDLPPEDVGARLHQRAAEAAERE